MRAGRCGNSRCRERDRPRCPCPLVDEQFLERDRRADDVLCERLASLRGAGALEHNERGATGGLSGCFRGEVLYQPVDEAADLSVKPLVVTKECTEHLWNGEDELRCGRRSRSCSFMYSPKRRILAEARRLLAELDGKPGVHGSGGLRGSYKKDGGLLGEDSPAP